MFNRLTTIFLIQWFTVALLQAQEPDALEPVSPEPLLIFQMPERLQDKFNPIFQKPVLLESKVVQQEVMVILEETESMEITDTLEEEPKPSLLSIPRPSTDIEEQLQWSESLRANEPDGWSILTREERIFMVKMDRLRVSLGLKPLRVSKELTEACRSWSNSMQRTGFRHAGNRGGFGENICYGFRSGLLAFNLFRNSPPHWRFLCNSRNNVCGIGTSTNGKFWTYRAGFGRGFAKVAQSPSAVIEQPVSEAEGLQSNTNQVVEQVTVQPPKMTTYYRTRRAGRFIGRLFR